MSDWNKSLAKEIAKGLINTGIEAAMTVWQKALHMITRQSA